MTTDEVEDEADILSHDSDDDPTWAPKNSDNNSVNTVSKESEIVQNFTPRKRKRIGPGDIGVKKVKNITTVPPATEAPSRYVWERGSRLSFQFADIKSKRLGIFLMTFPFLECYL